MTLNEINDRVRQIDLARSDPEQAHCLEDDLYMDVLISIATDPTHASALALAALHSKTISFSRWSA